MRVAVGPRVDFRDLEAIGAIEPLPEDFGAADHRDLSDRTPQGVTERNRARIRRRCRDHSAGGAIVRIARDHDVGAVGSGRRPGKDSKVLRPMITGLPMVSALKRAMSDFNRHGIALPAPMTPVLRNRNDEDDLHQDVLPASRVSAGPETRHSVQSSSMTAPSDL